MTRIKALAAIVCLSAAAAGASGAADSASSADERPAKGYFGPVRRVQEMRYRLALDGSGRLDPAGSTVVAFDKNGLVGSEEYFDEKGIKTSAAIVQRDRKGRAVGAETRSAAGKVESKVVYGYDATGKLIEESYFSADGKPAGGYRYEYGAEGKLTARTPLTANSAGPRVDYRYDAAGRLVEETYSEKAYGGTVLRIEHIYRDGVRVRSADYQRGRWLEYLTFYDYDKLGNRLRETSFQIPESEYGASFETATVRETLPRSFLASETVWTYEFYEGKRAPRQ